jgi:hypothetical protein
MAMETIAREHREIHEGEMYSATKQLSAIAAAASAFLEIRTPTDRAIHLKPVFFQTDGPKWNFTITENPTIGTPGTNPVPTFNRNRNNSTPAKTTIFDNPATISAGTVIDQDYVGGGTAIGGTQSATDDPNIGEFILLPNAKYILKATNNGTGASSAVVKLSWYEEP